MRGYDPRMGRANVAEPITDAELAHAFDAGEIQPWFQPHVAAGDGRLLSFEGLASPQARHHPTRRLPVALPGRSDAFRGAAKPARLGSGGAAGHGLGALRELGCGINLDDFRRENTTVAGIRRFAATRFKIDQSLVSGPDSDPGQREIAAAIVTMARGLGIATLTEGVERIRELTVLAEIGCDAVQGFGIARPMPAEDAPGWIAAWQSRHGVANPLARTLPLREATGKTA